jgi:hypothetical protein
MSQRILGGAALQRCEDVITPNSVILNEADR